MQKGINSEAFDLDSKLSGIVSFTASLLRADCIGVWLFGNAEPFSCHARAGDCYDIERLGQLVLARLVHGVLAPSSPDPFARTIADHDSSRFPSSIAIVPVRVGGNLVGALAAFSLRREAFAVRDMDNLALMAGVSERALNSAIRSGCQQIVALQRATILRMLERLMSEVESLEEQATPNADAVTPATNKIWDSRDSDGDLAQAEPLLAPARQAGLQHERAEVPFAASHELNRFSPGESGGHGNRSSGLRLSDSQRWRCRFLKIRSRLRHAKDFVSGFVNRTITIRLVRLPRFAYRFVPLHSGFASLQTGASRRILSDKNIISNISVLIQQANAEFSTGFQWVIDKLNVFSHKVQQLCSNKPALFKDTIKLRFRPRIRNSMGTGTILRSIGNSLIEVTEPAAQLVFKSGRRLKTCLRSRVVPSVDEFALRSGTAVLVLTIMATFLLVQLRLRNSVRSEAATAVSVSPLSTPPAPSQFASAAKSGKQPTSRPTSHLEITDTSVAEALHERTRYEIPALQRAADYGDDDAAFELGMAYEIGYYVPQNCTKAAHWVKVAAEEGNPAAEYNLGLRYLHGDGMASDHFEGEHWLKKAAAQVYSPFTGIPFLRTKEE